MSLASRWGQIISEFLFPRKKSEGLLAKLGAAQFTEKVSRAENRTEDINSLFSYRDALIKDLIWLIKYKKRDFAIRLAAELLLEETLEDVSEQMIFSGNKKILLMPIPISRGRLRERGYNQMSLVAEEMMRLSGDSCFELAKDVLVKTKETKSQTSIKNRKERLENVVGCFAVQNPEKIRGRNVLVIDDVSTTGATLLEAKKILKKSGALKVELLSLAH